MIKEIGHNVNSWSWEYDQVDRIATLKVDLNTLVLHLTITNIHTKSGLGKGKFTKILSEQVVGTLSKPNKGLISSTLKKYKQTNPFSRTGWYYYDVFTEQYIHDNTLNDLFNYTNNYGIISRFLKIKKIKENINGIRLK